MIKKGNILSICLSTICFAMVFSGAVGQNNVGIGTTTPHASALLEIADTSRGVLITQTDTASIEAYVNSLTPPAPIADGLIIYEVNARTYMYYDGVQSRWRRLIDLVGPTGPTGNRGERGPTGPTGFATEWRDSANAVPVLLPRDGCGDYYLDNFTGKVWTVKCDANRTNPRWVDTLSADNFIGVMKAPDEVIITETLGSNQTQIETPSGGGLTIREDISLIDITGLNYSFRVEKDEIVYIWVFAHGTTSFAFGSNDYGYAQYDLVANGGGATLIEGQLGNFFFDRDNLSAGNMGNIVTLAKNGPPPPFQTFGRFDQVGWSATGSWTFQGPLTNDPPCETRCGIGFCPPCQPDFYMVSVKAVGGNRVSNSNSPIIVADQSDIASNKRNKAFMSVFLLRRRSPFATAHMR